SPWRDKISLAILDLQEKGVIQMLYNKWWKSPGITCSRDDKNKDGKANALGVDNIGGVFVVLMCGLAVAVLTAIAEFCWNSKKSAQSARVGMHAFVSLSYGEGLKYFSTITFHVSYNVGM
ncbi:Glutamate receptor ionotropic, kainate 5, partial [Araneus ventricosus]